ncbi:hypothetical protein WJX77_005168 [Trebouxia sp. C0004]
MPLADLSGSELSGPSSELIRSSVKLDDLSGVPHSGILPRGCRRSRGGTGLAACSEVVSLVPGLDSRDHILLWTRTGPLSFKAFARGDISSL